MKHISYPEEVKAAAIVARSRAFCRDECEGGKCHVCVLNRKKKAWVCIAYDGDVPGFFSALKGKGGLNEA